MVIRQEIQLAESYFYSNNNEDAKKILIKILEKDSKNTKANELLSYIYGNTGDIGKSRYYLKTAIKNNNASPEALYYFGILQFSEKKPLEAKRYFLKAATKHKYFFEAIHALGIVCTELGELEEALTYYEQAKQINPNSYELFYNIGKLFFNKKEYQKAIIEFEKSIYINPNFNEAWHNKGAAHKELNQYEDALKSFDRAISLNPKDYDSICNKSVILLVNGNFSEGWKTYSYRWKQIPQEKYRHREIKELTDLNEIKGKSILAWWEQGFGDTIQFSRYIDELIKITPNVTFEVQKELLPLLKNQFNCNVVTNVVNKERFDYQVPLLNLPYLFETTIDKIPRKNRYINADPIKTEQWKSVLNLSTDKKNIGISISGNPNHPNDERRSISIKFISSLMEISNLYLIQKNINEKDRKIIHTTKLTDLSKKISDFSDTAAIIENMDLIISVDTSLIHLAGSMGKKSYLILPYVPEWRWLLHRNHTPWYPSIEIYRQKIESNWEDVIAEIKNKILN
ncbi:MAG: tetratricopeptide repeat protein [Bacteroidetes bacterium]|nr:tetratricopeptide repeat protein [Bacteroidota bacterium]